MKKVTIKDVAQAAGVSISVVSYVLNDSKQVSISQETKQRVRTAAQALGYVPNRIASAMKSGRLRSLGVMSHWPLDIFLHMQILQGISRTAAENGYRLVLCSAGADAFSYLDAYYDKSVDGIILISPYEEAGVIDEPAHIRRMQEAGVPFVMVNGQSHVPDVNYVRLDLPASTAAATAYLVQKGYTAISYVTPRTNCTELRQRQAGYLSQMEKYGLQADVCLTEQLPQRLSSFRAVVANKSDTAHAVMAEAARQGVDIPGKFVLIAGNDEAYSAFMLPPISAVRIPGEQVGAQAAAMLIEDIAGRQEKQDISIQGELVIRGTCP